MVTGGSELIKMRVNCPGGRSYRGYVTRDVVAFINSSECDPQTRMSVYQSIIQQEKTGIDDQSPPEKIDTEENTDTENNNGTEDKNGTEPDEKIDNQSNMTMIHNWTEEEEKLLITLRSDMNDKFFNLKQHDTLWNEILKKMKEEGVSVSRQQVINKWKNLKKKFKEIVDSNNKTGNNPTKWKHFQRFNQLFGNKASTNLAVIIDTSNKDKTIVSESIASDSSVDMPSTSGIQATKKRKICRDKSQDKITSMIQTVSETNENVITMLKEHHTERMVRMDRFLNILEKFVDKK